MHTLIKGEKREIPVEVVSSTGSTFLIATATWANSVESGNCTIDHTDQQVSAFVDTSKSGYVVGETYTVEYSVTITGLSKVIKGRVQLYII
jgi:hypothetical protein